MNRTPLRLLSAALFLAACSPGARALPKFAQRENKPCAYCHVKPTGGGKRNAAGTWYAQHGFSFRGYKPGAAARSKPKAKPQTPRKAKDK